MRQGQQSRRGRGRGRKTQNPLSRNFESNGPDVKIRGTAAHIAEKYATLARDAVASGNIISAENYYQHAEHYNRIIMAAQTPLVPAGQPARGEASNGAGQRPRRSPDRDGSVASPDERASSQTAEQNDEPQRQDDTRHAASGEAKAAHNGAAAANGSADDAEAEADTSTEDVPPDSAIA